MSYNRGEKTNKQSVFMVNKIDHNISPELVSTEASFRSVEVPKQAVMSGGIGLFRLANGYENELSHGLRCVSVVGTFEGMVNFIDAYGDSKLAESAHDVELARAARLSMIGRFFQMVGGTASVVTGALSLFCERHKIIIGVAAGVTIGVAAAIFGLIASGVGLLFQLFIIARKVNELYAVHRLECELQGKSHAQAYALLREKMEVADPNKQKANIKKLQALLGKEIVKEIAESRSVTADQIKQALEAKTRFSKAVIITSLFTCLSIVLGTLATLSLVAVAPWILVLLPLVTGVAWLLIDGTSYFDALKFRKVETKDFVSNALHALGTILVTGFILATTAISAPLVVAAAILFGAFSLAINLHAFYKQYDQWKKEHNGLTKLLPQESA